MSYRRDRFHEMAAEACGDRWVHVELGQFLKSRESTELGRGDDGPCSRQESQEPHDELVEGGVLKCMVLKGHQVLLTHEALATRFFTHSEFTKSVHSSCCDGARCPE